MFHIAIPTAIVWSVAFVALAFAIVKVMCYFEDKWYAKWYANALKEIARKKK
jgi:hypothetical protein